MTKISQKRNLIMVQTVKIQVAILAYNLQLKCSGGENVEIKIPLRQHVGGLNTPIVAIGDKVYRGQLIAILNGLGANIHSSFSGRVDNIDENYIIIKADEVQPPDYIKIKESTDHLELIKEAGIVGAGGAGFPTHIKINTKLEDGCVIVNAAECEPILNHNMIRIGKEPDIIIRGLRYVMNITGARKGFIAIKPKNTKPMIELAKEIKEFEDIEIKYLPDVYPAGDERVIIREILGIKLKPGQLPLEAKAVVLNIETIRNITLAIEERRPVITKDVTVGGRINSQEKVFLDVPIGIPVKTLIDKCNGYVKPYGEIVLGGPFTGKPGEEDSPITKTLGGILVTMPFPNDNRKFGVIGCECGADITRLKAIAEGMGGKVVGETNCKRMVEVNGRFRCEEPGVCPGQAEKVMYLKKNGAEAIIVGTCEP